MSCFGIFYVASLLVACAHAPCTEQNKGTIFCDEGWVYREGKCYLLASDSHCIQQTASDICISHCSNLITINDEDENHFTHNAADSINCYHIGLRYVNGVLAWEDGTDNDYSKVKLIVLPPETDRIVVFRPDEDIWFYRQSDQLCGYICEKSHTGIVHESIFYMQGDLFGLVTGDQVHVDSKAECALSCSGHGECLAFHFDAADNQCTFGVDRLHNALNPYPESVYQIRKL